MEVLHGDITITLSDADAIRGMQRIQNAVKRGMRDIDRKRAVVNIEGNLKDLKKDLRLAKKELNDLEKEASASVKKIKQLNEQREKLTGSQRGALTKQINSENKVLQVIHHQYQERRAQVATLERTVDLVQDQLVAQRQANKEAALGAREAREREKAEIATGKAIQQNERALHRTHMEQVAYNGEVAKLQKAYDKANRSLQRMQQTGKFGRAVSPVTQARFDINEREALGDMAMLRAKLEAMGAKPIDIRVDVRQSAILEKLAGIGQIGMRLGPFTGTLGQFTKAALVLGPILTGLLGSVTALAGALGTGLTGALGITGSALVGFGGAIGVAFMGLKPHYDDLAGIIKRSEDYEKKVAEYGKTSEEAGKSLAKLKHIMGDVDEATLQSLASVDKTGARWRRLTSEIRPDFFKIIGEGITAANKVMPMFARHSVNINKTLFRGARDWMRGLSSFEGQSIISRILGNADKALDPLMDGLGALGAALGRITASFSRHFGPVMSGFRDWARGVDDAASNTERLDRGVDNLMDSAGDVGGLLVALGRLFREIASAAMGPGGDMLDDMAGGINRMADAIDRNPEGVAEFFGNSIETTQKLYGVLKPMLQLFFEFSTILRPLTNIALDFAGAVATITQAFAGFGPVRWVLTGLLGAWFLSRTSLATIGLITGAVNGLAAALGRAGAAGAAARLGGVAAGLGAAGGGLVAGRRGGRIPGPVGTPVGGGRTLIAGNPLAGAGAASGAAQAAKTGGLMSKVGTGLSVLSRGLLGVSAPVAGLGLAAVGATIGLKKIIDAGNERRAQVDRAEEILDEKIDPRKIPRGGRPDGAVTGTQAVISGHRDAQRAHIAAAEAVLTVNRLNRESIAIQQQMVDLFSQRANSALFVEQAERAHADAVKEFGKNSLEARVALIALQDAKRADVRATEAWRDAHALAGRKARQAVESAQAALAKGWGTQAQEALQKRLDRAKDSLEAFRINAERAKRGLDGFSGPGTEKIGNLLRTLGDIRGVRSVMLRVDDQEIAVKLADTIKKLDDMGRRRTITKILADAKDPETALALLEDAFKRYERRDPKVNLKAEKRQAKRELDQINAELDTYGMQKPEALLKARDEAQAKIDALNRELDNLDGRKATVGVNVTMSFPDLGSNPGGARRGPRATDGEGDAWGIAGKAAKFVKQNPAAATEAFLGSSALGGMPAKGSGLNAFNGLAQRFGLTVGSGFRPGSITSSGNPSYHAMGRARDFPGPPGGMMAFAQFMAKAFGARLKELIYTPLGFSIKNGRRVAPYAQKDHYDHVHVAMARGGRVDGGRFTKPTVLFGEEAPHPEYFISTNPRDRRRSAGLITQAAAEVGLLEHSPGFYATRKRGEGDGPGFAVGGKRATSAQAKIIFAAIRHAQRLGANEKAIQALIQAIMHESRAKNLAGGDRDSRGILQIRDQTAKAMGINNRSVRDSVQAFLTKGFTGKGSAIALSKRTGRAALTPDQIANMVQGNATGTGVYRAESGNAQSALRAFSRGVTTKGGAPPERGARTTLATKLARMEGRYTRAQGTASYADDIRALVGRPRREEWGAVRKGEPGLIKLTERENTQAEKRLAKINAALKKPLRPETRERLLTEKEQLTGTIENNRTKLVEMRKSLAMARFEQGRGPGQNRLALDSRAAAAASTVGNLDDDMQVAQDEKRYWEARRDFANEAGDIAGATEAQANINAAAGNIRSIEDEIKRNIEEARQNAFRLQEAQQGLSETLAASTGTLNDDLATANKGLEYWRNREAEALSRGDTEAAIAAAGNISAYTDKVEALRDDMRRLPLERDRALAALTETTEDDRQATVALRDYWQTRLDEARRDDDIAGQIEAAGNLKSLNDEIKQVSESVNQQMFTLDSARRDLLRSFGSNFVPTGASVGAAAVTSSVYNQGTTVTQYITMQEPPPDAHTWSKNVGWELQAAV